MRSVRPELKHRVASLFAGIGGICLAFKNAGAEIIWANEIDHNACVTYRANFGDSYLVEGDITEIRSFPHADILTAGFPCQAFSIAGYQKGFTDERGNIFFEVIRAIRKIKPKAIFLENVKNLENHDRGKTFRIICDALRGEGYHLTYQVMNAMEYGDTPQNRERIYIVGFRSKKHLSNFRFPLPIPLNRTIHDLIDIGEREDSKYYYDTDSQYYSMISKNIKRKETVYQLRRVYIRENKSNVCPTLTANMGSGGHNVPIIMDNFGFRKLTPRECFLFQGFPKDFVLPKEVCNTSLYHQAGNSVVVPVVQRIAEHMMQALGKPRAKNKQKQGSELQNVESFLPIEFE